MAVALPFEEFVVWSYDVTIGSGTIGAVTWCADSSMLGGGMLISEEVDEEESEE